MAYLALGPRPKPPRKAKPDTKAILVEASPVRPFVNDSIVLIDFINRRLADGRSLEASLLDAGRRRFRPVVLTSVTTIAGMLPILLESQRQALVLIPMATSLAFGLMLATVLVLILAPTFYLVSHRFNARAGDRSCRSADAPAVAADRAVT